MELSVCLSVKEGGSKFKHFFLTRKKEPAAAPVVAAAAAVAAYWLVWVFLAA